MDDDEVDWTRSTKRRCLRREADDDDDVKMVVEDVKVEEAEEEDRPLTYWEKRILTKQLKLDALLAAKRKAKPQISMDAWSEAREMFVRYILNPVDLDKKTADPLDHRTPMGIMRSAGEPFLEVCLQFCIQWFGTILHQTRELCMVFERIEASKRDFSFPFFNQNTTMQQFLSAVYPAEVDSLRPVFESVVKKGWNTACGELSRSSSGVATLASECAGAMNRFSEKLQTFLAETFKRLSSVNHVAMRRILLKCAGFTSTEEDGKSERDLVARDWMAHSEDVVESWHSDARHYLLLRARPGEFTCNIFKTPKGENFFLLHVRQSLWSGKEIFHILLNHHHEIIRLTPRIKLYTERGVAKICELVTKKKLVMAQPVPNGLRPPCIVRLEEKCARGDPSIDHQLRHALLTYHRKTGEIPSSFDGWVRKFNPKEEDVKSKAREVKTQFTQKKVYAYGCKKFQIAFLCPYSSPEQPNAKAGEKCALALACQPGMKYQANFYMKHPTDIEDLVA
jgi:hypothetical protein